MDLAKMAEVVTDLIITSIEYDNKKSNNYYTVPVNLIERDSCIELRK